jgi:hypothetical protein
MIDFNNLDTLSMTDEDYEELKEAIEGKVTEQDLINVKEFLLNGNLDEYYKELESL